MKKPRSCCALDCDRDVHAKGLCRSHYAKRTRAQRLSEQEPEALRVYHARRINEAWDRAIAANHEARQLERTIADPNSIRGRQRCEPRAGSKPVA